MDFSNLIGQPIEQVKKILDDKKIKYIVAESSDIQKRYDTILVVKTEQKSDGSLVLTTDKFLLYI